jgi:serine protease
MYASRLLLCLSLTVCAPSFGADTEVNPVRRQPPEAAEADVHKVIVKFRGESLDVAARQSDTTQAQSGRNRAVALAQRAGLTLKESHELVAGMHAMQVQPLSSRESLATSLARFRADPAVEYAEPDHRRYIHAIPNDPLFLGFQWHLKNDSSTPSAIDAVSAWDTTQGGDGIVIAVIDTGVRFDHPDLKRVAAAGRLLDGYDFIIDPMTANDGDGRDADASDPGDWCQASDTDSSWHGTRVSGIVGAMTNNATGVAGITWQGRILPVRALGKCGGDDSDIIQAVLWAAGIHVSGVADNPDPARIINMSLGSTGTCPLSWQDAISQVVARGVLVVASAGNEGGPVASPANCPGVAAVAGLRHAGTKVGFSSLGPKIALSAPAGNCVNDVNLGEPCLYSIDTTSNDGTTTPGANTYTDPTNFNVGTSFSAPIVAGIAALMAAVNSQLDSAQLIGRLQSGAKPFPKSPDTTVPDCHVPAGDLQTSECNCTTNTCGAGMASANGSVAEALRPVAVATADPTTAAFGQTVSLDGSGSFASNNRSIASYAWTVVSSSGQAPAIADADTQSASFTAAANGVVTLRLTVTDSQGAQGSAHVGVTTPVVTVTVSPSTASVSASGGTQAFTATVGNTSNTAVTWQVDGVTGGNSTVGTISTSGLYTAPARVPSSATVTVTAISNADITRSDSAQVTITQSSRNGGGGGGGGAFDGTWLLACLLALVIVSTVSPASLRTDSPP